MASEINITIDPSSLILAHSAKRFNNKTPSRTVNRYLFTATADINPPGFSEAQFAQMTYITRSAGKLRGFSHQGSHQERIP
ncbi:hypothetical protein BOTNAR_0364g00110 [Botryotinia narcissicola]|uniref:Uncharacterized protein n=1 Tax=Botryotinia narcissicola TaxID=278944 RepID=A0A4Z1HXF8_9HELO|nr:hypothetical protein BOTNAR_0364g00110 [Botryotinia narcissicola]